MCYLHRVRILLLAMRNHFVVLTQKLGVDVTPKGYTKGFHPFIFLNKGGRVRNVLPYFVQVEERTYKKRPAGV